MQISTKDWINYISKLTELSETAGNLMKEYVGHNGFEDTDAIIDYAYALVTKYGNGTATLAAAMYDAIAEMQGKIIPPAEPAPTSEYGNVAKAVNGTIKKSKNLNTIGGTINRLVKKASTDTILQNAARDGAEYAWVPMGDTCAFCITLASRGWLSISRDKLKNHRDHLHSNCDCTYAVRFDGKSGVAGYDPDKYLEIYQNAEGTSSEDKINAIRRMYYAEHKDMINAQKRAAYAERIYNAFENDGIITQREKTGDRESMNRARNINTIDDLKAVSQSQLIDYESIEDIQEYFKAQYNIDIMGFSQDTIFDVISTLAGFDDMLREFGEISENIKMIQYVGNLKAMGEWNANGTVKIGKSGLRDYGTGVHEAAHALDYVRSKGNISYSTETIEKARKALKLKKNSIQYRNLCIQITGDVDDAQNPAELFAYSIETAKGGVDNALAKEVYKEVRERPI